MGCLMVFLLHPGLGDVVESRQRQIDYTAQHRHQPAFEGGPERLLFGVLVRGIRQCGLVQDSQGVQPRAELLGLHGRTVIGHQCPGQSAPLQRLADPVHQGLGSLVIIPLQMTDQPGVIVQNAQ